MGMMDLIKGMLGGNKGGALGGLAGMAGMAGVIGELLDQKNGGLAGLVDKFKGAGLGEMVAGWISTGPNPQVSPDQLHAALGSDLVANLAAKAGIDQNDLLGQLSSQLPALIDKLTPDGQIPDAGALQANLGSVLGGLFGKG